ncbi:nucleoprotein [Joinjakaka virus]|uniref:Nucleoprotein n=1 Tax=Joinjakaka virus TaxID=1272943 RepID=A0A0D3R1K1_9RHAB|nr:nucleoprotein [Joinjakaka virus]AJR28533.1 nucleoprotein [Joinjakaka virus]
MFSLSNKSVIKYVSPSDKVPPQYPSEYFKNHLNSKPSLTIGQKKLDLPTVRQIIKAGILKSDIKIQHVNRYLFLLFKEQKERLDQQWASFGVTIGTKDEDINPFSLVDVSEMDDPIIDGTGDNTATPEDDPWMALYLVYVYRHSRANNAAYQASLFERLKVQISAVSNLQVQLVSPKLSYKSWLANRSYCKIIAVLDMFYCKFPESTYSFIRYGSVTTRYRDFAALLSLDYLRETTGMEGDDVFGWMFTSALSREANMLMEPGQEIDKCDSYTPYMMDLGLSLKSPYSASNCPNTYTWCHIICTLLMSIRGKNARMVNESNLVNTRMNGVVVAFVYSKNFECDIQFTKNKDLIDGNIKLDELANNTDNGLDLSEKPPAGKDPLDWFLYLKANDFQLPAPLEDFAKDAARKLTNVRIGSIGKHISEVFM